MKPATLSSDGPSPHDALSSEAVCSGHGLAPAHFERALLADAREFLARPGKALRARMIQASFALAHGAEGEAPAACLEAVELLHAGSLIVDDIEDEAESRRGGPALHRSIGTARALNTGNWLYFVALSRLDELELDAERARDLSRAAHRCLVRCHEGQALDLALRVQELKRSEAESVATTISRLKTGALMGFAAGLGARVAHATPDAVAALTEFGENVGIALQMLDDLGSFAALSRREKAIEDLRGQRVNWVWAWAAESLDEVRYKQLTRQVARHEALEETRLALAESIESIGRQRVRSALDAAEHALSLAFAEGPALEAIKLELSLLEKSYG